MCGATQQQKDITDDQANFYKQLTQQYGTTFGQSQAITGALTKSFSPIVAQGPSQEGYSDGEKEALNTQAAEGTAAQYANAQTATAEQAAAAGGGNAYLPSGVTAQANAQNNQNAAATLAAQKTNILSNSYAQGNQNYQFAAGGLSNVAQTLSPTSLASTATGAGNAASNSAYNVAQAANSPWQAVLGAGASLGGAAINAFAPKSA